MNNNRFESWINIPGVGDFELVFELDQDRFGIVVNGFAYKSREFPEASAKAKGHRDILGSREALISQLIEDTGLDRVEDLGHILLHC